MPKRGGCLGCLGGCLVKPLLALALGCVVVWGVQAVLNPWALHIGGRSTPLMYWHGTGTVVAKDGKKYPLYLTFSPGRPQRHLGTQRNGKRWAADLIGMGWLCVAPGNEERMKVSGTLYGSATDSSDGEFGFRLLEWRNPFSFTPPSRGFFDVGGTWHGDQLVMDEPDQQGIPFKSGMLIDHATVTLHWADRAEFDGACGAGAR